MPNENKSAVLILRAGDAPFRDAVVLGQGLPLEKDGQPVKYAWKESLPLGSYLDKNGTPFEVTPQRNENLIRNFKTAKAKGFTPPILDRHEKTGSASMGFIVDARKGANGSLELLHQFIGPDAIIASARNKTSICTVANVTDETGETFDELIDHQALIPDPQLNNLSDFTPALAASRGQSQPAVLLTLAASDPQETLMDLKPLREAIGAAATVTDDQLIALAVTKFTETKSALATAEPALELSRTQATTIQALTQERDAAKAELALAKQAKPSEIPLDLLTREAGFAVKQIDLCLSQGKCTKAQADILKEALKDGDKPALLMLSKSGPAGTPIDVALKVLELNKSMIGTVTGQQLHDPNNPNPAMTPERKSELLSHAGL